MTAKSDFHRLRVAEVRRETVDAVSILFDVPDRLASVLAFEPGQYLTLRHEIAGEDIRRNYSVCASPLDGELRVAVKRVGGGRFSTFANETLQAGDLLDVLKAAAGSGITPVLSLVKTALLVEPESRFTVFYGNRVSANILFHEELSALKNRFMGRLSVFHFLTSEEEEIALFNGRLDRAKCDEILDCLVEPSEIDLAFVCGPEDMMQAAEQALQATGVPASRILLERFANAGSSAILDEAAKARVQAAAGIPMRVVLDGRRLTVAFDADQGNILDSVRAAGAPAPFACKGGVCATCRAKLIEGRVEMRINYGLTPEEVAQGYVLTCQSTPVGEGVVLSYDA
jgi:ring-1,2-phenylacetyl-CoA epoxidase subunit PaaE